jgi:hypothetical protein
MSESEPVDDSFHKVELNLKQPNDKSNITLELVNIFSTLGINGDTDLIHSKNNSMIGFIMIGNTELVSRVILYFSKRDGLKKNLIFSFLG